MLLRQAARNFSLWQDQEELLDAMREGILPETTALNRLPGLSVFILAGLTFVCTVRYGYIWDDPYLFERVRGALADGDVLQLFTTAYYVKAAGSAAYYRPVMMATLLGEVFVTGGVPWVSHLLNAFIHAFNSLLVYYLLRRILNHMTGALAGAALFAVHPVHAETVAAVFNRMDLLALALLLPAAILWTPLDTDQQPVRSFVRGAALFSFFLACLTKETAFMLPVVFLILQALRWKRPGRAEVVSISSILLMTAVAFSLRWTVLAREGLVETAGRIKAGTLASPGAFTGIFKIIMVNMRLAVWPFPSRSHWAVSDLSLEWTTFVGAGCFLFLAVWAWKRCPRYTQAGLSWWLIFTVPVLGVFNLGQWAAAERYAYIPSVGIAVIAGGLVASFPGTTAPRKRLKYITYAVILCLGAAAALNTAQFRNNISLFKRITATNPGFASAHLNLGAALAKEGRFEEALVSYNTAAELVPGWTDPVFNRGNLHFSTGQYAKALLDFMSVLEMDPSDWEAELNIGNVYAALGKTKEAAASYQRAGDLNDSSGKPFVGLGVLAARRGDYVEASGFFTEASRREPGLAEAYEGLAGTWLALGVYHKAEEAYMKALEISPGNANVSLKLGKLLAGTDRHVQASAAFKTALASDPSQFEAWIGLIRSLDAAGMGFEADRHLRELESRNPELAVRVRKTRYK